jgi:predicted nuclease of restriction endonuclease-like (RecB) superfamily
MSDKKEVVKKTTGKNNLYQNIKTILIEARSQACRTIGVVMVNAYWQVGRLIVEEEQQGKRKADYGTKLISELSARLSKDFGKGFDERNLFYMRQFYLSFPKLNALRSELSWTHYRLLMRVENEHARDFYINECAKSNWSTRQLERQIQSLYYERLLASRNKLPVKREADARTKELAVSPEEQIKDPYVLEFLGLKEYPSLKENQLEQALIGHLQKFLLELGRGFSFVARQMRVSTETQHFYIDLVFYNYLLKCFVIIDLKTSKLTHQDIGQMDMYVRLFEEKMKQPGDNPTIGIILCTEKDETIVKYSVLKENKKLFASKYKLYLPSEKELKQELEKEMRLLELPG